MNSPPPPAVQRAIPPSVVTRLGNPVLTRLLSTPRRAVTMRQSLLPLHLAGRRTGRVYTTPVAYDRQVHSSYAVRREHLSALCLTVSPDHS